MLTANDLKLIQKTLQPQFDSLHVEIKSTKKELKAHTFKTVTEASDAILSGVEQMFKDRDLPNPPQRSFKI